MTHFIDLEDHSADWIRHVLTVARELRRHRAAGHTEPVLTGKTLAMLFEKPSLRTRVSFEQAMLELGGHPLVLHQNEVGLGQRETVGDMTRVLNGMVHGLMARVFEHRNLRAMAEHAEIPVINALSDASHPCQALADVMTLQDEFGEDLTGRTLAFIGDGNNVARSLARICAQLGIRFTIAAPPHYTLDEAFVEDLRRRYPDAAITVSDDPPEVAAEADAIYTDTYVSMGQESEKQQRQKAFAGYRVNTELLNRAPDHAVVLHCLPAHRGEEITDEVMDGPRSRVFPQAHNRLHAQKGLLAVLMGGQ